MELPIIAFDIGAPAERLRSYKKGKLVKIGEVEEVVKEMMKLVGR